MAAPGASLPELPSFNEIYKILIKSDDQPKEKQEKVGQYVKYFMERIQKDTLSSDHYPLVQKIIETIEKNGLVAEGQCAKIKAIFQAAIPPVAVPPVAPPTEIASREEAHERQREGVMNAMVKFYSAPTLSSTITSPVLQLPCVITPISFLKDLFDDFKQCSTSEEDPALTEKLEESINLLRIGLDLLWQGIENKTCLLEGNPQEMANLLREISGFLRKIDKTYRRTYFKEFQKSISSLCHEILAKRVGASYTYEYAKKFKELNIEKASGKIESTIRTVAAGMVNLRRFSGEFRWGTFLIAEHMGKGPLAGSYTSNCLRKAIESLNLINLPNFAQLKKSLEFALLVSESNWGWAEMLKASVAKLEVNESLAFSSESSDHGMLMMVTCTGIDQAGNKLYKVIQHNEGFGIERFHYQKVDSNGRHLYQTALEIVDVSAKNITSSESTFFLKLITNSFLLLRPLQMLGIKFGTVEAVYEEIIPLLKGRIAPPSDDPRLWSEGQLGGSCSASCIISFIRSQVSISDFEKFMNIARHETAFKSFREIKGGEGDTATQKVVTLEMIKDLEHRYKLAGKGLPKELQEMYRQLMEMQPGMSIRDLRYSLGKASLSSKDSHQVVLDKPLQLNGIPISISLGAKEGMISKSCVDNLNIAFTYMKENNPESLLKMYEYLKAAQQQAIHPKEIGNFIKLYQLIRNFYDDRVLGKEQLYKLTVLFSVMFDQWMKSKALKSLDEYEKQDEVLQNFLYNLHSVYNALHLSSYFKHDSFDRVIRHFQRGWFQPKGPQTPKWIKKMQA